MWAKHERLAEFFRRLEEAVPCSSTAQARSLIDATLNAVEDEMTGIPYNPPSWKTDGRMYPAQDDSIVEVPDFPEVLAFRHFGHRTFIGANGSLEIRTVEGAVLISKPGADGDAVWGRTKETKQ